MCRPGKPLCLPFRPRHNPLIPEYLGAVLPTLSLSLHRLREEQTRHRRDRPLHLSSRRHRNQQAPARPVADLPILLPSRHHQSFVK